MLVIPAVRGLCANERCAVAEEESVGDFAHLAHASERIEGAQRSMGSRRVHR